MALSLWKHLGSMLQELVAACRTHKPDLIRNMLGMAMPASVLYLGNRFAPDDSVLKAHEFMQSMQWVLISYMLVSTARIGKTAQKSVERSLGTIAGGVLGLLCALTGSALVQLAGMMLATMAGVLAVLHLKKETTGRLLPLTYVIVTVSTMMGGDPLVITGTRVAAILVGILLCFVMSIVCYPESAGDDCYKQLLAMMAAVLTMGKDTWACWELDRSSEGQPTENGLLVQQQQQGEQEQQRSEEWSGKQRGLQCEQQEGVERVLPLPQNGRSSDETPATAQRPAPPQGMPAFAACAATPSAAAPAAPAPAAPGAPAQGAPAQGAPTVAAGYGGPPAMTPAALPTQLAAPEAGRQWRQQQQDPPPLQVQVADAPAMARQHLQDECEKAMCAFFDARTKLKGAAALAASEKHYFWLCGRPVIGPRLVAPRFATACSAAMARLFSRRAGDGVAASISSRRPVRLPAHELTAVAVSLRHCVHVWWMLLRLLVDGFDRESLEAVTTARYPATMLDTIQQTSLAVLQQAKTDLQQAVDSLHHHKRRGSAAAGEEEEPNLLLLRGHMSKLRGQLALWRQIYLTSTTLKRMAIENLKHASSANHHHHGSTSSINGSQPGLPSQAERQLALLASASAAGGAAAGEGLEAQADQQQQQQQQQQLPQKPRQQLPQLPVSASWARLSEAAASAAASTVAGDEGAAQAAAAAAVAFWYLTPPTQEGAMFALQWHALHYCLQQLEEAFEDLTSQLENLLHVMALQKGQERRLSLCVQLGNCPTSCQ